MPPAFVPPNLFAAEEWKEEKGDHFIIYYQENKSFAKEVLRKAEMYYKQVSSDLGHSRYLNFWQWENRVKIYIYPTREEFLRKSGAVCQSHCFLDGGLALLVVSDNFKR